MYIKWHAFRRKGRGYRFSVSAGDQAARVCIIETIDVLYSKIYVGATEYMYLHTEYMYLH